MGQNVSPLLKIRGSIAVLVVAHVFPVSLRSWYNMNGVTTPPWHTCVTNLTVNNFDLSCPSMLWGHTTSEPQHVPGYHQAEILFHLQYLNSGRQQQSAKFIIRIYDKCSESFKFTRLTLDKVWSTLSALELFPLDLYVYVCTFVVSLLTNKMLDKNIYKNMVNKSEYEKN